MRTRTARSLGLILVLLGAWGGIVSYVGPRFSYRMGAGPAWQWTTAHTELHAGPGAAIVVGGLALLVAAPRIVARLGAILALLGGMWLVVGPLFASMWLGSASESQLASTTLSQAVRPLGYHYGTGLLVVAAAAYAWALCGAIAHTVPYPAGGVGPDPDLVEQHQFSRLSRVLGRHD
jgi:hypothetical protein